MRKIEREMNAAIRDCRDWKSGNTEVCTMNDGVSYVYLHGNKIAEAFKTAFRQESVLMTEVALPVCQFV